MGTLARVLECGAAVLLFQRGPGSGAGFYAVGRATEARRGTGVIQNPAAGRAVGGPPAAL